MVEYLTLSDKQGLKMPPLKKSLFPAGGHKLWPLGRPQFPSFFLGGGGGGGGRGVLETPPPPPKKKKEKKEVNSRHKYCRSTGNKLFFKKELLVEYNQIITTTMLSFVIRMAFYCIEFQRIF